MHMRNEFQNKLANKLQNHLLKRIGCATTSSFNPAAPHAHVIFTSPASARRKSLDPFYCTHAWKLVKTNWLPQARHDGKQMEKAEQDQMLNRIRDLVQRLSYFRP